MESIVIQYILVGLLFAVAVGYLAHRLRGSFKQRSDKGCSGGCGSCGG